MPCNCGKNLPAKNILAKLLLFVTIILACFLSGYGMGSMIGKFMSDNIRGILLLLWLVLSLYISLLMQIIIHECGHLAAGLISGYKFISFRIGRLTIIYTNGKLKLKKYTIAGTAGQCLMKPPKTENCRFPYILYNLGGILGNIIACLVSLALYFILPDNRYLVVFLYGCLFTGILFVIFNGLPIRFNRMANDGCNVCSLWKNEYALRSFWVLLTVNALLAEGVRLRDMPGEWFGFDREKGPDNPIICSLGVLRCAWLSDRLMFDEARELSEYLEKYAPGIQDVQKNELRCEILFAELTGLRHIVEIERLYDKKIKKYIKATRCYPSRKRLMYTYELLYNNDGKAAANQLAAFEKLVKTYPYPAQIDSERELIDYVNKIYYSAHNGISPSSPASSSYGVVS